MDIFAQRLPLLLVVCLALAGSGCDETIGPGTDELQPIALRLVADADTLLLLPDHDYTIKIEGIFAESNENIITNSGVLADTSITYITTDTTVVLLDPARVAWQSTNMDVARVTAGKITGVAPGLAAIWASLDQAVSDSLPIIVTSPQLPPYLIIDPPPTQLIFQDYAHVSGWITAGLDVGLTLNGDSLAHETDGRFIALVDLDEGNNIFEVIATNPDNNLTTTKTKQYIYYPIATAGIIGHWAGETLTRPFAFDIYEFSGVYVIDGTLTIDATVLGGPLVVQDVIIAGQIHEDGTIDATLSLDTAGILVTGFLNGVFLSTGTAAGEYGVTIAKAGWPTVAASAKWTAVRE